MTYGTMNYGDLNNRPLKPTLADRYWANAGYYNRQAALAVTVLLLIGALLMVWGVM
jgi:hypothetical protein